MQALAAFIADSPDIAMTAGGLLIGALFGSLAQQTNYCTMGAISDWRLSGNLNRLGAVALAAAVAILGAQALDAYGVTDLSKSIYLSPRINWLGALAGGMIFGAGMVYAGGCPSRTLIRAGGGDMRGVFSLAVMAITAYATISGVLSGLRVGIDSATAIDLKRHAATSQGLDDLLALAGLQPERARWSAALLTAVPLLLAFAPLWWVAMLLGGPNEGSVMHLLETELTSAVRTRLVAAMLIPVLVSLAVLWQVWQLFGEYRRGRVFSAASLAHLRRFSWALVGLALVQPLSRVLMSVAISLDNPPGHRHLVVSFSSNDFAVLLLGLVFVAIARVMVEAARAAEEVEQFV